jgi:putative FmdB family regulatory protein
VPTYQYACTECGDRTEVVQKFSDDPLTVCAVCGGRLRKVFSPVGIVFKGSGFYRTDSRSGNGTPAGTKDKADSVKSADGSSSSSGDSSGSGPGSGEKGSGDKKPAASVNSPGSSGSSGSGSKSSASSGEKVA